MAGNVGADTVGGIIGRQLCRDEHVVFGDGARCGIDYDRTARVRFQGAGDDRGACRIELHCTSDQVAGLAGDAIVADVHPGACAG